MSHLLCWFKERLRLITNALMRVHVWSAVGRIAAVAVLAATSLALSPAVAAVAEQTPADSAAAMRTVEQYSIGVMSDPHYFPAEYQGTRAEDYQNQISGDLRLMGENGALTEGAVDQMLADDADGSRELPSVLLVTGDLSSEGEKASHEGFAEQMARLQEAGVTVLVIPGNHDLYNDSAMTFQNDTQVRDNGTGSLYTTEADFREIYASMGYDAEATIEASNGTIAGIDYYAEDLGDDGIADCQGGLSYVAKTSSGVAFMMIDTEVYTADFNGQGKAAGSGGGMMSDALLAWVKAEAAELTGEGYTIIAGVHHPVLNHQGTAETEFITDRIDIQGGEGTAAKDNTNAIATQLANAGIHYVFSGHMHENDVASYTTAAGNVIYDIETGGLCAYPAPYHYANISATGEGELALDLWSISVEQAAMNARLDAPNGSVTDTDMVDVQEYMTNAMYGDKNDEGESFITRLVMRYAARYLDQLVDIPAALQNIAGLDLYDTLFDALPGLLGSGTTVDLDSLGSIYISWNDTGEFNTSGVNLDPSGAAGLLSSFTIRNEDIQEEVASVLDQIEANYIANGRLEQEICDLLENVGDVNLLNPDNPDETPFLGESYTLRQLLRDMFQRHNSGQDKEPMSDNMRRALENLASSPLLQNKVEQVLDQVLFPLINEVLQNTTIDVNNLFGRNTLWHTAVQALLGSDNPSIATVLDKFGFDLTGEGGLLDGLIDQYLTDSVYNQIGGLASSMIRGFATDADTLDDVVDGAAVQLKASMNPEPHPTVENGALPDQVSMSLDADGGASSRNFSWYTATDVEGSDVQVIAAKGIADASAAEKAMDAGEDVITASGNTVVANKAKVTLNLILITNYEIVQEHRHTATITVPAGDFYYRVGSAADSYWSDPVRVDGDAADPAEGYTAIVVADSQGASEADYDAYEQVLAAAEGGVDGEAFALHLGDMVDDGSNENYWSWLMDTDASRAVATMPVAGNHEARQDDERLANAVAAHYNVDIPEQDTSTGIYYSFVMGDVTYIVLNTNDGDAAVSDAQQQWAAGVADAAETTWKVLVTHKAPYSKGSHQNDSDVVSLRGWLNTFCTQHGIDLVLSGHDHTYMRTPSLTNGTEASVTTKTVTDSAGNRYEAQVNPAGTTFVIPSTSGSKYYDIVENDLPCAVSWQEYQPVWSTLEIDGDTLFWRSYAYDASSGESTCIDSFAITKDNNLSPAEKVMGMIDALPDPNAGSEAILAAQADVEAARAAYEELEGADQAQVSNLSKLEQLEQLIKVYQDIAGKEIVDLSTGIYYDGQDNDEDQRRAAFKEAIANPNVGTIILPGDYSTAIGTYSGNTLNNQYYTVDHNVVIKAAAGSQGFADLRRCGFIVTNGATLVLEDVKLQAWQKKPFFGNTTPMNMIRVENGTLVANGNTSVLVNRDNGSTDGFKDESWRGHAIIVGNPDNSSVVGDRAVYLNTTGTISGLRDSVVQHSESSSANDAVHITGGTYNTIYTGNSSVNLSCQLEIDGGTFTKVTSYGDLVVGGGAFNGASVDYPIWMGDDADLYVESAGSFEAGTSGRVFHVAGELHITSDALVKLGDGLGLDIAAGNVSAAGWPLTAAAAGLGETDEGTIYAVGQQITTLPGMAANQHGALDTAHDGSALTATASLAPSQTAYAYARYHVMSGSALMGYVDGNTDAIYAYSGYTMLSNPSASISLTANPGAIVAWDESEPPTVDLTATIEPHDATSLITWESSDEDVATVDDAGHVTFKTAGQVTITATHATTGAKATIVLMAVAPAVTGSDTYGADVEGGLRYGFELKAGDFTLDALPAGYTVAWSLNDGAAATVSPGANPLAATLARTEDGASTVTITATLMKDDQPTGIAASKQVAIEGVPVELQQLTVTPDEGNTGFTYDGSAKAFGFTVAPEGVAADSFTVEYRAADAAETDSWSGEAPVNAGTYDVRVTRAADDTYEAYSQVFEEGLVIAKATYTAPDIRYASGETTGSVRIILQNGNADMYYWSESDDLSDALEAENNEFEVDRAGTFYIFAPADENHNASEVKTAGVIKVTFDDGDGIEGEETEGAVFTDGATDVLMAPGQALRSWGGMPEVSWEGHELVGWTAPDGSTVTDLTAIHESMTLAAQWNPPAPEPGPVVPTAPDASTVAQLPGVSVVLRDINELNGAEAYGEHPDVAYAAGGENPLIADSFTVAEPAQDAQTGAWTAQVTLDGGAYLNAYSAANGAHYFADPEDQEGERTFILAYDAATGAWAVADGEDTSFAFDITCLTLRPADAEIYTGGESETGGHFVDQYVVDGQGEAYAIDELNSLLAGQTARIAYFDESGTEITDDTQPGTYEARIVIEGASRSNGEAVVTVDGKQYAYALEPAELVIRSVSDSTEAERGDLNVDLLAATDAASVQSALAETAGGVVASLPAGTTINFNGNAGVPLADTSGVTLLSDDLLPGQRETELVDHAEEQLGVEIGTADTYDFQYLDLVDESQSNAWVSSSLGTDIYWRIPEGADPSSIRVYHFNGLHRDYDADDAEVSDLIAASTVETVAVQVDEANGYVSFHVDESGFSPFLMTWEQAEEPGTDPGNPDPDPERPAPNPDNPGGGNVDGGMNTGGTSGGSTGGSAGGDSGEGHDGTSASSQQEGGKLPTTSDMLSPLGISIVVLGVLIGGTGLILRHRSR